MTIGELNRQAELILGEVERAIVGKREALEMVLLGILAAVGIAVGAYYAVNTLNWSSAARYSSEAVRL